jgi:DNA-directed RNA polymerase subunit F
MVSPKFIEEQAISLADAKKILSNIAKEEEELNYISNKAKEYLDNCPVLVESKKNELNKKLQGLDLTRLKHEHIMKIIDFLPRNANELKVVLQAYPLSMPKKDQDAIVAAVKDFLP